MISLRSLSRLLILNRKFHTAMGVVVKVRESFVNFERKLRKQQQPEIPNHDPKQSPTNGRPWRSGFSRLTLSPLYALSSQARSNFIMTMQMNCTVYPTPNPPTSC